MGSDIARRSGELMVDAPAANLGGERLLQLAFRVASSVATLIDKNRAVHRRPAPSEYLIVLPSELRPMLGVPREVRVVDLHSLQLPQFDLAFNGVIGVQFSDALTGREVGISDLWYGLLVDGRVERPLGHVSSPGSPFRSLLLP